jgi:hypothetical protein
MSLLQNCSTIECETINFGFIFIMLFINCNLLLLQMIGIGDEVIFIVSLLPLIFIPVYFLMYAMRNFFAQQTGIISN